MRVLHYVHHQGSGHRHRATALAAHLRARGHQVTLAGYRTVPDDDPDWLDLPLDHDPARPLEPGSDPTAGGLLHWAPLHEPGLRRRMAMLSQHLESRHCDVVVSDVSQEVTMLARLHGVPVVSVVLPGRRSDGPHLLGLGLSSALVGCWPPSATAMTPGLPSDLSRRLVAVGAISRFAGCDRVTPGPTTGLRRRLVVLGGLGGDAWDSSELERLVTEASAAGWVVDVLGADRAWVADPWPVLCAADLAVVAPGQNAVADVAAARVPALVVAAQRPFAEQDTTAAQLDRGPWPVRRLSQLAPPVGSSWPLVLDRAAAMPGAAWATWGDDRSLHRVAAVLDDVVGQSATSVPA